MNLLIVGINHNSAPVHLREQVAFTQEQLGDALSSIATAAGLAEVAILSTCNRTEIIATSETGDHSPIVQWLADYHNLSIDELGPSIYNHQNHDAVSHAMHVAAGLDSMVVGESQILGQFKDCFEQARRHDHVHSELNRLSQTTFRVAKRVRNETDIGKTTVSVASTAVTLAEQLFTNLNERHILLIGAGETSELVGKYLTSAGIDQITIANRTIGNARRLAEQLGGEAIDLQSIPQKLTEADVVIACTASQLPILGKGTVERVLKGRRHRPILMVDLAVPRDIEPEVSELRDIYLYSVDDLQQIIDTNVSLRQEAADEAAAIIESEVSTYKTHQEERQAGEILMQFRAHHEQIKEDELNKAKARIAKGDDPEQVLQQLANQLTNKIIHSPSIELKKAAANNESELLDAADRLFQMNPDKSTD